MQTGATLQRLQLDAYRAVLRAMAVAPLQYEQEKLLTSLRKELHVDMGQHAEALQELNYDEEVNSIREALNSNRDGGLAEAIAVDLDIPPHRGPGRPGAKKAESSYGAQPVSARGRQTSMGRHSLDNRGGKKAKQNVAQLVEVEIPGAGPPRAPVALDPSINELIGKKVKRFWPSEGRKWYDATISNYSPEQGHCLVYHEGTNREAWEWVKFERLKYGAETQNGYMWVDTLAVARGSRRKQPDSECPVKLDFNGEAAYAPFHEATFKQQVPQSSVQQLSVMQRMLDWREVEIQNEIQLLDSAEESFLEPAAWLPTELDAIVAQEKALQAELTALAAY